MTTKWEHRASVGHRTKMASGRPPRVTDLSTLSPFSEIRTVRFLIILSWFLLVFIRNESISQRYLMFFLFRIVMPRRSPTNAKYLIRGSILFFGYILQKKKKKSLPNNIAAVAGETEFNYFRWSNYGQRARKQCIYIYTNNNVILL